VFAAAAIVGGALEGSYVGESEGGYSNVTQSISELAANGSGVQGLMMAAFVVLGVSSIVFGWAIAVRWRAHLVLAVLVGLTGVTTIGAGLSPCDPGCPTTGDRSTHQQLHDAFSAPTFVLWIACLLTAAWRERRTTYGRVSLALGGLALVSTAALATMQDRAPDDPVGLLQRTLLGAVAAWYLLTALALGSDTPSDFATRRAGDAVGAAQDHQR
jgi:hypothetical protein